MTPGLLLLGLYVGGALSISFLCSLLEAGLLSARTTELAARKRSGERGAAILLDLKSNRIDDAISAILTLNTIAHTVGATLAGAQAAVVFGDAWVGVFSGVLTLLVLVVTEIIPKTIGAVYASRLAGFVGRTTLFLVRALVPILTVTRALTRLVARHEQTPVSRGEIAALLAIAVKQGTVRDDQKRLFDNVLELDQVCVSDVMTPRTVCVMLPADTTLAAFLDNAEAAIFSRIPLYSDSRDEVRSYVIRREVLEAMAQGEDRSGPLSSMARDVSFVPEIMAIGNALRQFLERREPLAMVVDEFGAVSGLVTMEDLMETILGAEIIDETDRVIDMRAHAMQLRDVRLKRLRQQRALAGDFPDSDQG